METASAPSFEPVDVTRPVPRIYPGLKREYEYQGVENVLSPPSSIETSNFRLFRILNIEAELRQERDTRHKLRKKYTRITWTLDTLSAASSAFTVVTGTGGIAHTLSGVGAQAGAALEAFAVAGGLILGVGRVLYINECHSVSSPCGKGHSCINILGSYECRSSPGYYRAKSKKKCIAKDCSEVQNNGKNESGVYQIDPDGQGSFNVYCDMTSYGGGWTVFQRRLDGSVDFYRGWNDYKEGFGDLKGEFWLGLNKIYRLTSAKRNKLRVDLGDWSGNKAYAEYDYFAVKNESKKYQLSLGKYSGTAGDSLSYHKGMAFSTKDSDNDKTRELNCATRFKGAWWYKSCYYSKLNGDYYSGNQSSDKGVIWSHWKGHKSLKFTEMKIKP
ncbi:fibrinogen-like protein A [Xenia sp. Carnegie-2017]|uniref:fibrinogen-like protein A n=1 Tax=Xenia sp. Carnegie-2017 TaxID=2897299 RepID=UPI001F033377|nr:fibrinogen-like protein A [Xenia sp. Carnegie-2017]